MANKQAARIVGAGMTALYKSQPLTAVELMVQALQLAVDDTQGLLTMRDIDTLIALPSLMSEQHFMIGHAVAQQVPACQRCSALHSTSRHTTNTTQPTPCLLRKG